MGASLARQDFAFKRLPDKRYEVTSHHRRSGALTQTGAIVACLPSNRGLPAGGRHRMARRRDDGPYVAAHAPDGTRGTRPSGWSSAIDEGEITSPLLAPDATDGS